MVMKRERERGWKRRDLHSPHLVFKLGHDCIKASAIPKTATQMPISVRRASVERPRDSTGGSAVESNRGTCGSVAA